MRGWSVTAVFICDTFARNPSRAFEQGGEFERYRLMPDRFTIPELLQWLKVDSDLRILFVEGARDLTFWETIVPHLERRDIQIYAISSVEVPVNNNGERGRLVACARAFSKKGALERVRFFMDADNSRVLDETILENIISVIGCDARLGRHTHIYSWEWQPFSTTFAGNLTWLQLSSGYAGAGDACRSTPFISEVGEVE